MTSAMIDFFALALSHGLLALAAWRIMRRGDLDAETSAALPELTAQQPPIKPLPALRTRA